MSWSIMMVSPIRRVSTSMAPPSSLSGLDVPRLLRVGQGGRRAAGAPAWEDQHTIRHRSVYDWAAASTATESRREASQAIPASQSLDGSCAHHGQKAGGRYRI